jgi:hypothetical protein
LENNNLPLSKTIEGKLIIKDEMGESPFYLNVDLNFLIYLETKLPLVYQCIRHSLAMRSLSQARMKEEGCVRPQRPT